ncbi:hypothetical protein [Xanthobacter pseudotagetidis]|uniref:hypothetical protein n=1 Tax=Xanthobacter pseudotagetidis TaxID=3119911 RepID=UPI003729AA29
MVTFSPATNFTLRDLQRGGDAITDAIRKAPDNFQKGWQDKQERQLSAARQSSLADLGAGATYGDVSRRLAAAGDLEGARSFATLAMAESDRDYRKKRDEIGDGFKRQEIDIARSKAGTGEQPKYGMSPVYGVDKDNNPVALQLGSDGIMRAAQLPPGVTLSGKPIVSDTGTHFVFTDPVTRQPVRMIPKNVAEKAQQQEIGKAAGQAQAQIPIAEGLSGQIGQHIDDLANDPKLPDMLGPVASRLPNVSADAQRVQSRIDQLSGGAFLQARQQLKGGGAITDYESKRAEAAYARLNTAQSLADFNAALQDFRGAITDGLAKLKSQAALVPGGGQSAPGGTQQYGPGGMQPQLQSTPKGAASDPLGQARDAIRNGAPREAVIQRLRQMGINPEGL